MKMIAMKLNPAFKRTQPLPLLTAELAQRAGRAARSLARVLPGGNYWIGCGIDVTGRTTGVNLKVVRAGCLG